MTVSTNQASKAARPPQSATAATLQALTTRRIEGLAIAVIALLLLSSAVSLVTGSPRFFLAKDAALTTLWGAWFFMSLRALPEHFRAGGSRCDNLVDLRQPFGLASPYQ